MTGVMEDSENKWKQEVYISVSVRVGLSITSVCTRSDKIPFLEHTCGRFTRLSGQRQ